MVGEFESNYNFVHRNNTILYQKDLIGIKTLENEERVKFVNISEGHMHFNYEQIDNIVISLLLGN